MAGHAQAADNPAQPARAEQTSGQATSPVAATPIPTLAQPTTIKVGIMAGEDEDVWRVVQANAKPHNLTIKLVTFSDYTVPNQALAEHDINANAFQHQPYLDAQIKARGYHIVRVGDTHFEPMGIYSTRHASLQGLPEGATVAVPNDPSNEGRALLVLEHEGLIKVSKGAGLFPTALDITDNPKNLSVRELDAGLTGRAVKDVDAAVINTNWAIKGGVDVQHQRIAVEGLDHNPYVDFIAVNADDAGKPWVKTLVASFHQPDVAAEITKDYHGAAVPAFKAGGDKGQP
ncbi:MetQ/NlpA family ABC transporter substrate-binding protein [Formicincola oecophyllae]|uniref:Lipoprotein n=1 Tax=Formicincola oecophyllae TaxID=2558361 RepID=A0A4Y6UD67_9PROT|nr:MetQ/NlpA family ABC transporter substrate-binding protein [Formicincola oecophyllae]QDH14331.1 MetQ/NlpA family ABC transporter substrate-binding protein [Formicincola oecophyllae]